MWSFPSSFGYSFDQSLRLFSRLCFQVALLGVYHPFSNAKTFTGHYRRIPVWNAWAMLDFFWMSKFALSDMKVLDNFCLYLLFMFSYLLFLFSQKRHHSELHHEDLLWKPCFSTGATFWNLCSIAFAVFIFWTVRCRELKRIWIKTALVSLTIQNWYFLYWGLLFNFSVCFCCCFLLLAEMVMAFVLYLCSACFHSISWITWQHHSSSWTQPMMYTK